MPCLLASAQKGKCLDMMTSLLEYCLQVLAGTAIGAGLTA